MRGGDHHHAVAARDEFPPLIFQAMLRREPSGQVPIHTVLLFNRHGLGYQITRGSGVPLGMPWSVIASVCRSRMAAVGRRACTVPRMRPPAPVRAMAGRIGVA
jgi:hypothetical protein